MREPTVAAGMMDALFAFAVSKGGDRWELAEVAGFEPGRSQPDDRLPYDAYVALFQAAKRLTGDDALALRFGEEVDMSSFSVVGLLGPPPGSPHEVIDYVNRYTRLLIETPGQASDRLRLHQAGSALWIVDARPNPNAFPELTESTFARMASTARRMGVHSPISELHVTHERPAYDAEYDRIFRVPVRFRAAWNAVCLGDELLKLLPAGVEPTYAHHLAAGHAEALLRRLDEQTTFCTRTTAAIERALANGRAAVETIASDMGMSRQTLYRRLRREGVTYEKLHDQIRCRHAVAQLRSGLTPADVAHRLGFSDRAAFSRAFKRWTGMSPGKARSIQGF
ncbi:MAG TPA: AraC family transcriptional regulator ligand-binding domain-containing protein [Allosphingosinicella sp.]|jgi:AraC-like DNA-binding protein